MENQQLAQRIAELCFNKKGYDVKIIDLRTVALFADFFVLCSADSDVQVKAIADEIDEKLKEQGIRCWHKEGYKALQWVLLDYVDIVVHIFKKEAREYYNLERLWSDAPSWEVEDPALTKVNKKSKS